MIVSPGQTGSAWNLKSLFRPEGTLGELTYPNPRTLQMVVGLHLLETVAQFVLLGLVIAFDVAVPIVPVLTFMSLYAVWNIASWWHVRRLPGDVDCESWVIVQLLVETLTLAALLYYTGGATSPFVSLFLVPVAVGALCLGMRAASGLALLAAIAYTVLLFFHVPLVAQHMHGAAGFNMHVLGMWANFLVSGLVLLVFLGMLARIARERATSLSGLRELQLRNEQVMAMAGVAAGAAHSLATPLSTIAILLDELEEVVPEQARVDIELARQQLVVCRERLAEILHTSRAGAGTGTQPVNVNDLLSRLARQWHQRRPEADLRIESRVPDLHLVMDPAVGHGLATLLDNAADANSLSGKSTISMRTALGRSGLQIEIEDTGNGPLPTAGRSVIESTKPNGFGTGLMILRTNLERLGGTLEFRRGAAGCVAALWLPLPTDTVSMGNT